MKEDCFCGHADGLEHREQVLDGGGERALRCPDSGHLEYLRWLPNDIRLLVLAEEFGPVSARYAERPVA